MNHIILKTLQCVVIIGCFFHASSCTPKKIEESPPVQNSEASITLSSPTRAAVSTKTEIATIPAPSSRNDLAQILTLKKNVDYRLSNESIWKPASAGNGLNRNDALQTQEASQAQIKYKSGTQLELKQNSLIVFDADPGSKTKASSEDRVVFKKGELVGTTKTELWVFTQAGLVQIKPPRGDKKIARAKISMPNDQKLNLTIEAGSAELIYAKNNKYEKLQINNSNELILNSSQINFSAPTTLSEIIRMQKAMTEIKVPTRSNLIIENPKEDTATTEAFYVVSGHIENLGGQLLINGDLVSIESDLKFSKKINLSLGANLIVFQLIRSDSSVQFFRRNIKLSKPL